MRTTASTTATGAALLLLLACSSFVALASAADAALPPADSDMPTDSMREGETAEEPLLEVAAEERAGAEVGPLYKLDTVESCPVA
jgi:Spy/CpxP family protein refolding chaperone